MRITANITADNALYNLQQGQKKLDSLQETITSGLNVNRPSDDPITSRLLLDMNDKIKAFDQYKSNIIKANSWIDFTNAALKSMNDIILQAQKVANTNASGNTDPISRQNARDLLIDLKNQIIDAGNTQYGDQYIFGGANNLVPPFNKANNNYAGDGTERVIEIATGTTQAISITGDRLLKGTGTNPSYGTTDILQTMDDLIAAVGDATTPTNIAGVAAASQALNSGTKQVFSAININLSRSVRLGTMEKLHDTNMSTLKTTVDKLQSVDMIQAGVELNKQNNAFQASLSATAKITQLSLLDFL